MVLNSFLPDNFHNKIIALIEKKSKQIFKIYFIIYIFIFFITRKTKKGFFASILLGIKYF